MPNVFKPGIKLQVDTPLTPVQMEKIRNLLRIEGITPGYIANCKINVPGLDRQTQYKTKKAVKGKPYRSGENRLYVSYKGWVTKRMKACIRSLSSTDTLLEHRLTDPRFIIQRRVDGKVSDRVFIKQSLFDYFVEKNLIVLTKPGVYYQEWVFTTELFSPEGIAKHFDWHKPSPWRSEWMKKKRMDGSILPPDQKKTPRNIWLAQNGRAEEVVTHTPLTPSTGWLPTESSDSSSQSKNRPTETPDNENPVL